MNLLIVLTLVVGCNAAETVHLLQFERATYDLIRTLTPVYAKTSRQLNQIMVKYQQIAPFDQVRYLNDVPNILNDVIPLCNTYSQQILAFQTTFAKLTKSSGNGPRMTISTDDLKAFTDRVSEISVANLAIVAALNALNTQIVNVLKAPVITFSQNIIGIKLTTAVFANINTGLTLVADTTYALSLAHLQLGALQGRSIVQQQSPQASSVLSLFFGCFTNVGYSYANLGADVQIFASNVAANNGVTTKTGSVTILLPTLYNSINTLLGQTMYLYNNIQIEFETLVNEFWGSYALTNMPPP